ncbi:sugar ABC transporter permease [Palleronia sp. LCG004]|uniref:carbohydrate ABC transporter permease n=1 Tax=Palleronia sp. LCG004 TaxID=3079304 RepID=UPI00294326A9|nr:sugar ABC transporter permease [Palleronia sp. LCG004]WOI58140.1 sugar ABC transporter permease [Palleronia sp. LCG004]
MTPFFIPARLRLSARRKRTFAPYLYLTPSLLVVAMLMLLPMAMVVTYSFQRSAVLQPDNSFAGLMHYREIFADPVFWSSLWHTLYFTLASVVMHMVIGLLFALMLNSPRINPALRSVLRVLYILPWLFTQVIIAVIWRLLLEPNGIVNSILTSLGIIGSRIEWFSNPETALHAVTFANIWAGYPIFMVSILAGLQGIPKDLYEAADIDGATGPQKLFFITIPQLMPIIVSISLLDFIWTMQVFPLIWLTTGGGPIYATEVLSTYTYKLAFAQYNLSQASASAVVILLIAIGLTLFYIRHQKAR